MRAVVLAAGKGTRMKEITESTPKPMIEVAGRPILWHLLEKLSEAGVTEAAVIVGYKGRRVRDYFGDGDEVGLTISYFEQEVQDGTGHAADPARGFLESAPFFFTFGDILAPSEAYPEMMRDFERAPADLLMAARAVDNPGSYGILETEGDRVVRIVEKPRPGETDSNLANGGIFIADPVIFEYTDRLELSERGEYELTDAIRMMIEDGRDVRAFRLDYWRDVGTPEDLEAAAREMGDA